MYFTLAHTLILAFFFFATMGFFLAGFVFITKRSRKGRQPIGKDQNLLRQPGETLREEIAKLDERLEMELLLGISTPMFIAGLLIASLKWLPPGQFLFPILALITGAYLFSLFYRMWRASRVVIQRRNLKLGLMGERLVADYLDPLKRKGYHIFHDAPAQGAQVAFNLDHVVIGPTGVFLIETKTRTKANVIARDDDYKVSLEVDALRWPSYRDTESVTQTLNSTKWLQSWILQRLGRRVEVIPLLAIPGWLTNETPSGTLRAVNPKRISHHISSGPTLDAESVELIARQLDSLCRNVPCVG